jgi:hypothetical protein
VVVVTRRTGEFGMRRTFATWAALATLLLIPVSAGSADAKMPTAKIGENMVKLEVAASEAEIEHGLMNRSSMPEDQGMVFLFNPPRKVSFWMCHTLIPLDMLFIDKGKIVKIFHEVPPCTDPTCANCPSYPGGVGMHVTQVIELNGGYANRHSVKEGDKVELELK